MTDREPFSAKPATGDIPAIDTYKLYSCLSTSKANTIIMTEDDDASPPGEAIAFGSGGKRRRRRDRGDNVVTGIAIGGGTMACVQLSIRHC